MFTTLIAVMMPALIAAEAPASAAPTSKAPVPTRNTRYCFETFQDGPMVHRNVCKTREEWRRAGVRVSDYLR